jgi:hypothetical protein
MPSEGQTGTDRGRTFRSARVVGRAAGSWLTAAALAFGILAAIGGVDRVAAQRSDAPRIAVPPTILAEPASQAALSIQIGGPPGNLPNNTFVRLRGLPASVSLTEGYAIAPGSWAVPLVGLPSLKVVVPAGVSGRTDVTIHLVGVDGTTLAETKTALVVGPANMIAPGEPKAELPSSRSAPAVATPPAERLERRAQPRPADLPPEVKERAERLIANGDRHLEQGNVGAARMFFQRAAEAGLAAGAIKMAATYDPAELDRLGVKVQGAIPDPSEARKWYERARVLGAPEADERLTRIGGR